MKGIQYTEDNELEEAIFEAINVTRWLANGDEIYNVLSNDETEEVIQNLFKSLENSGYKIVFDR